MRKSCECLVGTKTKNDIQRTMRIERLELSAEHDVSVGLTWVEWTALFLKHNTHRAKSLTSNSDNMLKRKTIFVTGYDVSPVRWETL